jgi:hypothetical protein
MMRRVIPALAATLAIMAIWCGIASAATIWASPAFYSDYSYWTTHISVGPHPGCVKDQFGFYKTPACYDAARNDADYDVLVYQTSPGPFRLIHSERDSAFMGKDEFYLYNNVDLGLPFCVSGEPYTRYFRLVLRLHDPVSNRITATWHQGFWNHCSG